MNVLGPCPICGDECYLSQDPETIYLCRTCSIETHQAAKSAVPVPLLHITDNRRGDGFPTYGTYWKGHMDVVRAKHQMTKKYIGVCPCGIHPSQCDYHK